jgi:hypothetical protein
LEKFVQLKQLKPDTVLRERASDWLDKLKADVRTDWENLKTAFTDHFAAQALARVRDAGKVWSRSQSKDESVADYFAAMQKLSKHLPMSDEMLPYTVLNGLRPEIKAQVLQQDYNDLSEMLYSAQKAGLAFATVATSDAMTAVVLDEIRAVRHMVSSQQDRIENLEGSICKSCMSQSPNSSAPRSSDRQAKLSNVGPIETAVFSAA